MGVKSGPKASNLTTPGVNIIESNFALLSTDVIQKQTSRNEFPWTSSEKLH